MYKLELKKTRVAEEPAVKTPIRNSLDALKAILPLFKEEDSWREQCYAVFTDRQNRIIGTFLVGVGSDKGVTIGVKSVCAAAVASMASRVILAHNHPSGDCRPGIADKEQTMALRKALDILDIDLLDHIVLGDGEYFSFTEEVKLLYNKKVLSAYDTIKAA